MQGTTDKTQPNPLCSQEIGCQAYPHYSLCPEHSESLKAWNGSDEFVGDAAARRQIAAAASTPPGFSNPSVLANPTPDDIANLRRQNDERLRLLQEQTTEFELWKLFYNSVLMNIVHSDGIGQRSPEKACDYAEKAANISIQKHKEKWAQLSGGSADSDNPKK